jgi:hypothetical protein
MRIRNLMVIAAALGLCGCVASKAPLFDAAGGATPVAAGRFEVQEDVGGKWSKNGIGTLALEGRVYTWKVDGDDKTQRFTLHDAGNGYFVIMTPRMENAPHYYALFERSKDGWLSYGPTCADLRKVRAVAATPPKVEGTDCFYADRATLARALIAYAKVMLPGPRYVAVGK